VTIRELLTNPDILYLNEDESWYLIADRPHESLRLQVWDLEEDLDMEVSEKELTWFKHKHVTDGIESDMVSSGAMLYRKITPARHKELLLKYCIK
jgi:hypothetical protein